MPIDMRDRSNVRWFGLAVNESLRMRIPGLKENGLSIVKREPHTNRTLDHYTDWCNGVESLGQRSHIARLVAAMLRLSGSSLR